MRKLLVIVRFLVSWSETANIQYFMEGPSKLSVHGLTLHYTCSCIWSRQPLSSCTNVLGTYSIQLKLEVSCFFLKKFSLAIHLYLNISHLGSFHVTFHSSDCPIICKTVKYIDQSDSSSWVCTRFWYLKI